MTFRQEIGAFGEGAAAEYLIRKQFRIVARNFRAGRNEIDIIAENEHYLVFAEVKTRMTSGPDASRYGRPASAVDLHKQKCTVACAEEYLRRFPTQKQPRMDVVEVYVTQRNGRLKVLSICHMENAYGG